jgi:hypothetical protein
MQHVDYHSKPTQKVNKIQVASVLGQTNVVDFDFANVVGGLTLPFLHVNMCFF